MKNNIKTVGVVIPIYNVEKYLKECLDSVINQSYTNLEIILVNDGSTDENSLSIAKEYTLKDKRITLFDKKNGGLSSARNVGIEYFSGEYKLKNKTQTIKENSLIEFNLEGNNPYEIYIVYKSYKAFNDKKDLINFTYPNIDYIIFLDSDDYWELNCIEECVPRMDGVEVLWFNRKRFYDGIDEPKVIPKFLIELYEFQHEGVVSRKEWLARSLELNIMKFWFSVMGMIDFGYLKSIKLKFLNGIIYEDQSFGVLLFLQLENVFIFPVKMYNYRIRGNSIMNHDKKIKNENFNPYTIGIYKKFNGDNIKAKKYIISYSWCMMALQLLNYMQEKRVQNVEKKFLERMIGNYSLFSIMAKRNIQEDPCKIDLLFCLNMKDLVAFMNFENKRLFVKKVEEKKRCLLYKTGNIIL
ncbi:TPA: glycosyltransferase, partial [Campylobacter coli]|nr:glycosyltransferase [Campylobacter coli]